MSSPQSEIPPAPRRRRLKRALTLTLLLALGGYLLHRTLPRGDPEAEVDRLVDVLALTPGMAVAEIGAGAGAMTIHLAETLGGDSAIYATELNPKRLDQIREAIQRAGLVQVTVKEAGKTEANLPAECCDAIFMSKVYHHFTDPQPLNRSLYDSLKPGGAIVVIDFEPYLLWFWMTHPEGVPEDRGGHGVSSALVAKELAVAGFEIEQQLDDWWPGPFRRFCVVARKPLSPARREEL